jgi:hypothetical protein
MRYTSAAAFRQALEAHIRHRSQATGLSVVRLRKGVTFDRLLARLLAVAPDRWLLKGALALDFRSWKVSGAAGTHECSPVRPAPRTDWCIWRAHELIRCDPYLVEART